MNHAQLRAAILRAFPKSELTPASEQHLDALREFHPAAPASFCTFLREVGWGGIGSSNFMVYGGLCAPNEIYDSATAAELDGILIFGDDFSGWCAGFDTRNNWRVVGIENGELEPLDYGATISEFFARWVADRGSRR